MDTTRPSLLLRIRDRSDGSAWTTFVSIYRPMLMRFARARGLSEADAEDVAQHCLAAVAEKIAEFSYDPQKGRFKGWLRTLVNNRIRNLLRGGGQSQADSAVLAEAAQREPGPEETFERIWLEEHLWHCLRELRAEVEETTYQAFVQYVVEQRPVEEVCAALHLAPGNVHTIKWRLTARVAARMRELVDGCE
jgi:RNA polymerase sigma factor (sigma-70 family)